MENTIKVEFNGGEMRESCKSGLYMLAKLADKDGFVGDDYDPEAELYAEISHDVEEYELDDNGEIANPDKFDSEDYEWLKAEIISQAEERGISADQLVFYEDVEK